MPALGRQIDDAGPPAEADVRAGVSPNGPDADRRSRSSGRYLTAGGVVAVLLGGTVLRLVVLNAYLPYSHNLDEIRNVQEGQDMYEQGTLEQVGYAYPSLVFDVELAVLAATSIESDGDDRVLDVQATGIAVAERPGIFRRLRIVTGLLPGIITMGMTAAITWVLSRRTWTTVLATVLVALSPLDLLYGNYVTPDAWSGAASAAAVFAATLVALHPTKARYLLAGALVGVAAGAKYNCILTGVPLVVAHLAAHRRPLAEWRNLVSAGCATVALFVVVTPSALFAPIEVAIGFASVYRNYSIRGQLDAVGNGPDVQLSWLWYGFGVALLAIPLGVLARGRVRRAALVPMSFCVVYPLAIALPKTGYARNLLPVTGVLAAAAAVGVWSVSTSLGTRLPRMLALRLAVVGTLAGAVLAVPAFHAYAAVEDSQDDPWAETQEWLRENLEPNTVIATESWGPVVDERRFHAVGTPGTRGLSTFPLDWYELAGVDVLVTTSNKSGPPLRNADEFPEEAAFYRQILDPECRLFEASGGLDTVGGRNRPKSITIVVVSVADCRDEASDD